METSEAMNDHQEKWDRRFLDMALLVASWSKDPSSQIGAVITDAENRVMATGYNGFPRTLKDSPELLHDREQKYPRVIHAEMNAILHVSQRDLVWSLYSSVLPCDRCAVHIIQYGIKRVVCFKPEDEALYKRMNMDHSISFFREAGVELVMYGPRTIDASECGRRTQAAACDQC